MSTNFIVDRLWTKHLIATDVPTSYTVGGKDNLTDTMYTRKSVIIKAYDASSCNKVHVYVAAGDSGIDLSATAAFYTAGATGEKIIKIDFPVSVVNIVVAQLTGLETVDVSVYGSTT